MSSLRFYCLSSHSNKPCFLLKWPDFTIMLDCGLDMRSLLQFLPVSLVENERWKNLPVYKTTDHQAITQQLRECCNQVFVDAAVEVCPPESGLVDFSEIDVILISNYNAMLALPFITEKTQFKGTVFATDPTVQFGRLLMEELSEYVERTPKPPSDASWKNFDVCRSFLLATDIHPQNWRQLYSSDDIKNSILRIHPIAHNEILNVNGTVKLTATSSGICIGGCNWIVETDYEKIVYLACSSALMAHPKVLDSKAIKGADAMIVSSLTQAPHQHPDTMLGELCAVAVATVRAGGNVLVPCYPMGLLYDLLEWLIAQLDAAGCTQVPVYVVSHVADSALAFANIFAEWLAEPKQAKVFLPEEPFLHGQLMKNSRVKAYLSIPSGLSTEFKTPCIVFASHPSLRLGDAVHFMELWSNDTKNTVILTEPDFCVPEVLAPFQPLAMKAYFCPIDTSFNFTQLNKLLQELKPKALYMPDKYRKPPPELASHSDYCIQYEPAGIAFRKNQVLPIAFKKKFAKVRIDPELASRINFSRVNGFLVSSISGLLSHYGNRLVLEPGDSTAEPDSSPLLQYGDLEFSRLSAELRKNGFSPIDELAGRNRKRIRLAKQNVVIEATDTNTTHIFCDTIDENVRRKVADAVLQCLSTL